ncbi:EAL domain-containing protein [Halomonas sp. ISL-60]|uniref:bifunctional diguanylate cyclase/phosphodiesterase n=1 Tax=Halomonas sp. ISL-56 TaxID=2819149 RepID=UPI001BE9BAD9|nr:EAL domain-containing protein [Halomonas sp. ISL-56]MBT2772605.1 EAL domain-containing protein [Halomonas sp. ISL-60]MBT2801187.1 EAL domain-containing protein [Halomonas sp. ISL-56]
MHTKNDTADIFRQLAEGVGHSGSPRFYTTLVERLATILGVDHVLVADVTQRHQAETLAVWSNGRLLCNITYPLTGTPCETALGKEPCLYFRDVQSRFPDDKLLCELGAESYLGRALYAADGALIGLLAVLKNSPMQLNDLASEVLQIAAAQAGAELDRQKAEQALRKSEAVARESERRLDTLLNHLPGMAYRCLNDRNWTMQVVSQGAKALTGYWPDELQDNRLTSFAALIHPNDQDKICREVQSAIANNRPYRVTYQLRHRDGGYRWMWEQGQAVRDEAGDIVCLEGFISDVTDQQESQRVQNAVVQVASTVTTQVGDGYFQQLIATLVKVLEADAGFIALLHTSPQSDTKVVGQATTVSMVVEGAQHEQHAFALRGSPSEQVVLEREAVMHDGPPLLLPGTLLSTKAWIGRRLDNANGEAIGVMMVFYRQPLTTNAFATSVLKILSTGAAAELERRRDHRHMHQLAYTDSTTGLPNRGRFMELLAQMWKEAHRSERGLALLLLDIRRFKEVNDLHGHQVGDQLLVTVAERLQQISHMHGALARLSGDEFALLVAVADPVDIGVLVEQLRSAVKQPLHLQRRVFHLDVSIGFAHYPQDVAEAGELFNAASIALHHAKRRENCTSPYTQLMRQALHRRQRMSERLSAAIAEHKLALNFQPQVNLINGRLTGAEVLCRWYDDEWGWVSPGEFIPLAEERGLIRALGDWVLEESAKQLITWRNQPGGGLPGRLSINISAQQFADPELTCHIAHLTAGVFPSAIALELTESDFMRDPDQAVEITHTMRKAGYSLSIDDFGTGYSSLSYLRRFAADALKIDISFVREMLENKNDRTIVETIIAMAQALEMKTVAEGVETQEQARLLAEMGCNEAQGYWFGRPLPADEFAARWLAP